MMHSRLGLAFVATLLQIAVKGRKCIQVIFFFPTLLFLSKQVARPSAVRQYTGIRSIPPRGKKV